MAEPGKGIGMYEVDGIVYQARREPDLGWLGTYGRVFSVWDQQSSGNLCFGVEGRYGKLFVKYAGADTVNGRIRPCEAVDTLRAAMPLYAIDHPALTRLLAHGPAGEGYAAVFAWRDAPAMRTVGNDQTVRALVRRLPPARSLKMLDMVFDLHAYLAAEGIVAVDFWDGNVLIDFVRDEAVVCDIDLYRRKPAVNDRGRMWGSGRFMAPEEYQKGTALDECTTVYNMGALAFEFFGDNQDRTEKAWIGPAPLYAVASRATRDAKAARYPSMRAYLDAWREAVGHCRGLD